MIYEPVRAPIGAVLPYAGPIGECTRALLAASGWLFCDGAPLRAADYPELFAAIGQAYGLVESEEQQEELCEGEPGELEGWFCLPDYRGAFLRGVNGDAERCDGSPRDPDAAHRDPARCDGALVPGNSGNEVGSVQEDAFQDHRHCYQRVSDQGQIPLAKSLSGVDPPPLMLGDDLTGAIKARSAQPGSCLSTFPDGVRVAEETRAFNIYINFIIKSRLRVTPSARAHFWCGGEAEVRTRPTPSRHRPSVAVSSLSDRFSAYGQRDGAGSFEGSPGRLQQVGARFGAD